MLIPEASAGSRIAAQKQAASGLAAHFGTSRLAAVGGFLFNTVWGPLGSFFRKNGLSVALTLLGFIFLFKIGEAFMGKMSLIFYKEIGFSKSDIALYSKAWLDHYRRLYHFGGLSGDPVRHCKSVVICWHCHGRHQHHV